MKFFDTKCLKSALLIWLYLVVRYKLDGVHEFIGWVGFWTWAIHLGYTTLIALLAAFNFAIVRINSPVFLAHTVT